MCARVWGLSKDGFIKYLSLTEPKLADVVKLVRRHFFVHESISKAVNLDKNLEAIAELDEITLNAAKDGVSLIAVEASSGRVVGCAINKINAKENVGKSFFGQIQCKHPSARAYLKLNQEIDNIANFYDKLQTNCYMELMFASVVPELRDIRIASKLLDLSTNLAQCLKNGQNMKIGLNGEVLPLHPIPTALVGVSTTIETAKIVRKLEFQLMLEIDSEKELLLDTASASKMPPIIYIYSKYI